MTRDANDVHREQGEAGVRSMHDGAHRYNGKGFGVHPNAEEFEAAEREAERRRREEEREKERLLKAALPLTFFADAAKTACKNWIIKNVIARSEISSWIGSPGATKSTLLTDLAVHAAAKPDWRGHQIKEPVGVVYFALERANLVRRRLAAYRLRDRLPADIPIAVCGNIIDLMDSKCADIILGTIMSAEKGFGRDVGLVIIDTYNKGIAAGGGDEDKARDQNRVAANMRRILERKDLHIAGVGHTGKDETRGERGSNARLADVDLQVKISGDPIRTVTIEKANDQAEGDLTAFSLEMAESGRDEDGETIRTTIVSHEALAAQAADHGRVRGAKKIALELLERAIADAGKPAPASNHIPGQVRVVRIDLWRSYCDSGTVSKSDDPDNKRRVFGRACDELQELGLIGVWNEWVWLADNRTSPDKSRTSHFRPAGIHPDGQDNPL